VEEPASRSDSPNVAFSLDSLAILPRRPLEPLGACPGFYERFAFFFAVANFFAAQPLVVLLVRTFSIAFGDLFLRIRCTENLIY